MSRRRLSSKLLVYMNATLVGELNKLGNGGLEFKYTPAWLESSYPIPLSLSLPLQETAFRGDLVAAYFDNLLPDSEPVRKRLAESAQASSQEAFDLLSAIGRDCIGAIQLIPNDIEIHPHLKVEGESLNNQEIAKMIRQLKIAPLGYDREDNFRISIAGAQSKTALTKNGSKWLKPHGSTPTTHILKPPIGVLPNGIDLSDSVQNEYLCLKLCEFFGLPTAHAETLYFDENPCLVVERFDRLWVKNKILRLPQEDFCQALGVSGSQKYEASGGPGVTKCMKFLLRSDNSSEDQKIFLRAQMVFYFLGATDGHAKNFSLFLNPNGFRMTPIYDVLSAEPAVKTKQIRLNKYKMAMCFGSSRHYQMQNLLFRHFEESCELAGFPKQDFYEIVTDLILRLDDIENFVHYLTPDVGNQLADTILSGVKKRIKSLG